MNALQQVLLGAVAYLSKRPNLRANPAELVSECQAWVSYTFHGCPETLRVAGEHAAREVARPVRRVICQNLIEPEDLKD